jgi:hypothetical protein
VGSVEKDEGEKNGVPVKTVREEDEICQYKSMFYIQKKIFLFQMLKKIEFIVFNEYKLNIFNK